MNLRWKQNTSISRTQLYFPWGKKCWELNRSERNEQKVEQKVSSSVTHPVTPKRIPCSGPQPVDPVLRQQHPAPFREWQLWDRAHVQDKLHKGSTPHGVMTKRFPQTLSPLLLDMRRVLLWCKSRVHLLARHWWPVFHRKYFHHA